MNVRPSSTESMYRHIPGGLDNAVTQAGRKQLHDLFIIDTDCHQAEPYSRFDKYLPEKYRAKFNDGRLLAEAGRFRDAYETFAPDPKEPLDPIKIKLMKVYKELESNADFNRHIGGRIVRPEIRGYYTDLEYWEQTPEEVVDIFTRRIHGIGIKRSMIFPNNMLELGNHPDPEVEVAVDNAYIDYMLDKFLGKYPEILTCVCAPANSPVAASELIERVGAEKGVVGVMISPTRPGPLAGDESWNPIYEAAQQKDLPICFHGGINSLSPFDRFDQSKYLPIHAIGFPFYLIMQLTSLVIQGIPERFPKVKFVFMEGGVTWIPWMMDRLDSEYQMRRSEAPLLTKPPSEYIKQLYFTSQPLERPRNRRDLEYVFNRFGAETQLLYASDYPHWDFDVPSVIYDLPFLTREAKKRILSDNAKQLFKIN